MMIIYVVEYREPLKDEESLVVHLASTIEKAVEWIQQHGPQDWRTDDGDYFFAVFANEVDCLDYNNPETENFLRYYDRFGNDISGEESS